MFQHILVPLDGSTRDERALPIAARLARAASSRVILLRVLSTALEFQSALALDPTLAQNSIETNLAEAERYLAELTVSPDLCDLSIETVILSGSPAAIILSVAESSHADMIVICSHGYTGMKRWALGSVAEKVAHNATVPVLLLREKGPLPIGPHVDDTRPLRILVPLDGSVYAKVALAPAASLIAALTTPGEGVMHLMRVATPLPVMNKEEQHNEQGRMLQRAKRYLRTTTEQIREGLVAPLIADLKLPVTWSVAFDTDVARAIIRGAENGEDDEGAGAFGGCDVIAMATHGREGLQRWAMGSITEHVLHATTLPLLIIRPQMAKHEGHVSKEQLIGAHL